MATLLEPAMTTLMYIKLEKKKKKKKVPTEAVHAAGAFSGQFLAGSMRREGVLHIPKCHTVAAGKLKGNSNESLQEHLLIC